MSLVAICITGWPMRPLQAGACDDARTTVEMIECADRDYRAADARLNAAYQHHRQGLDGQGRSLLLAAQRAWTAFRDAECLRARDGARGGTMAPLLGIACLTDLTERRTADLSEAPPLKRGPSEEPSPEVFWKGEPPVIARFDCATYSAARVGLRPRFDPGTGSWTWTARVRIGVRVLDFPVGGDDQDAFCCPDLTLSLDEEGAACPLLRVDDGLCEAVRISWDGTEKAFRWDRN